MDQRIKKSTADQVILLGPVVDLSAVTPRADLTITYDDVKLVKHQSTTMAAKTETTGGTHIGNGVYWTKVNAADSDTAGGLFITLYENGTIVWSGWVLVESASVYDVTTGADTIAGQTLDEVNTGATHNIVNSLGRQVRSSLEFEGYGGYIWINTVSGEAGTTVNENGTMRNPVDSIADALTLSAATNINLFFVLPGSTITLAASAAGKVFNGHSWTLALGGQVIDNAVFRNATVSGTGTSSTTATFTKCKMGAVTLPGGTHVYTSVITGKQTIGSAGEVHYVDCECGTVTVEFDFGAAIGNTELEMHKWAGDCEFQNMGQAGTDQIELDGTGHFTINANCTDGSIEVQGAFEKTDNSGGAVTIEEDARFDKPSMADANWDELLAGHAISGSTGARLAAVALEATLLSEAAKGVLQPQKVGTSEVDVVRNRINNLTFNLGTDWPLTGKDVRLTVKDNRTDESDDSDAIIDRLCTVTDAANGVCTFATTEAEVPTTGKYFFELTVYDTGTSDNPMTPRMGVFNILEPVRQQ
jgi:hypothetical protein